MISNDSVKVETRNKSITKRKTKTRKKIALSVIAVVLILVTIASVIYVNDYYHADINSISVYNSVLDNLVDNNKVLNVTTKKLKGGAIAYIPDSVLSDDVWPTDKGLIFYPGGKVEYTAYEPLMKKLASKGILCVLVKMPCNLAVLDMNAADGIQGEFTDIHTWYIGGHSLGGAMAASYIADHVSDYNGLILLGAYSAKNISTSGLKVLSIYGSQDKVLDKEKYEKNKVNLPADYKEYVIYGGCHSYYGMYGHQEGDGIPTITNTLQIDKTAEYICSYIQETDIADNTLEKNTGIDAVLIEDEDIETEDDTSGNMQVDSDDETYIGENDDIQADSVVIEEKQVEESENNTDIDIISDSLTSEYRKNRISDYVELYQNPELPTGCEATALTSVLNYYGYNVSHKTIAYDYMERGEIGVTNPWNAFVGDPSDPDAEGCFAPVVVKTANSYLLSIGSPKRAFDYSNVPMSDLYDKIDEGKPVIIWATINMLNTFIENTWVIDGEVINFPGQEHCMVLTGYDYETNRVYVMDPLNGNVSYDMNIFTDRHSQLYDMAVVIE